MAPPPPCIGPDDRHRGLRPALFGEAHLCVGRNCADHAHEMGGDPHREPPFFFSKPADAVVDSGSILGFPSRTSELHHEVELVLALASGGSDIAQTTLPPRSSVTPSAST